MVFGPQWFSVAVLVAASFPVTLRSQADSTASIRGTASSTFNGHPLAGVMISIPAEQRFTVSDSTGRFELAGVPAGRQRIRVSYLGRTTEEYDFQLRPGQAKKIIVLLDVEALDLAPIVVEAQARDFSRNLAGFFDRKKFYSAFARFYTREDLDHTHVAMLSTLLARDGIFMRCLTGGCVPMRWNRGTFCAVAVAVDGMPFWETDFDQIRVEDVRGVEVYRSRLWMFGTAPQIATVGQREPFESAGNCGSVFVWTR